VIVVDDHLAFLAIAGRAPDLAAEGPVVTTWGFHFRMGRAVADSSRSGSLSRRAGDASVVARRVLHPPANRLIVLDPRASVEETIRVAVERGTNLLLAELVGAAVHHQAAIRVTQANVGRTWRRVMNTENIDFETVRV
jgi:hypothetical protein